MAPQSAWDFLGLTSYYKRFIRKYEDITSPLTTLLKKESFKWSETTGEAFSRFKEAVISPLVLDVPIVSKAFIIECNASRKEIGVLLM